MTVVRISFGTFAAEARDRVASILAESEQRLRPALTALPGLRHYYAGLDAERNAFTNVSVWDSLAAAHQMDTLPEMLAQRPLLEAVGVVFTPITNHECFWQIQADAVDR